MASLENREGALLQPAKRRRTALERAAVGSLDIRDCFRRSSVKPTAPARSLSLAIPWYAQQYMPSALWTQSQADLVLAGVWRGMPAAASSLLVHANLTVEP